MISQDEDKELVQLDENSLGNECIVPFSTEELKIITSEFKGKVEVIYTLSGMKLKASKYVGTIILPKHMVNIKPKISNANFMSMIIYALRLPEIGWESLLASENPDFYNIIIRFLINYLDNLIRQGLYKGYITKTENLGYVRGKIAFKEHLLHNLNRNDKIFCSFSEISVDTLENRIIKFTLFYLTQYSQIDNKTRLEIISYYKKFHMVRELKSVTNIMFRSIIYTPLNDHYRIILNLCELILKDSSLDVEKIGQKNSLSFLINMESLFQDFIARLLIMYFGERNIVLQNTEYFDMNKELMETSDILLRSGKKAIILDTKYKDIGQTIPPAEHVRQVFCYSRISNAKKCVLIYASNKEIPTKQYNLPDNICLFRLHFNMKGSSKEDFDINCSKFIDEINNIISI